MRRKWAVFETDPQAEANVLGPRRTALDAYNETLNRLHLDGFVYPATQMPPPDETMPQDGRISEGPHSENWMGQHDRCSCDSRSRRLLS